MAEVPIPNCFDSTSPTWGVLGRSYQLLKAAGNVTGPWVDTRVLKTLNAHIYGTLGGGNVQLYGSNDQDPAVSNDSGIPIGAPVTVAGMVPFSGPYRYVRAISAGSTGGSINVVLQGVAH